MGLKPFGHKLKYRSSTAIFAFQHVLLWGSIGALIVVMDILSVAYMDVTLRPTAILLLLSSLITIAYLTFHSITARRRMLGFDDGDEVLTRKRRPSYMATRLMVVVCTMWLVTSGANLIVAARQPVCLPPGKVILAYWQSGGPCVAQRAGSAISILALIASCILFATIATSHNPFQSHLLGTSRDIGEQPVQPSMSTLQFPKQNYRKTMPSHSHSNSITSTFSEETLPPTSVIPSRTLSPVNDASPPVGLGIYTDPDFPVDRPMSVNPMRTSDRSSVRLMSRQSVSQYPIQRTASAYGNSSRFSRSMSSVANDPYQHSYRNSSMSSLPGFTPMAPIIRPSPAVLSESAFKAIHPPAHHFRHTSSSYSPVVRPGSTIGLAGLASLRAASSSSQLSLGGRRTPSLHSGYGYRTHSRSRSAGMVPLMTPATVVPLPPTHGSSRSSSSGSGSLPQSRLRHVRSVSDELINPETRRADLDMAVRLEQKLAEVQARLESKQSQSISDESISEENTSDESASDSSGTESRMTESSATSGASAVALPKPLVIKKSKSAAELGRKARSDVEITNTFSAGFSIGRDFPR